MISDCAELGRGADVFMNMRTYNAASYASWLEQLAPALAPGVPRASLGAGLGCWVEHASTAASARSQGPGAAGRRRLQPVPAWSLTAQSAKDRVCVLMNHSVQEIDMFRLAPHESPPFPEPFWIPALEKYMAEDSGCSMPVPPPPPPSGPAVGCPALVRVCPTSVKRGVWALRVLSRVYAGLAACNLSRRSRVRPKQPVVEAPCSPSTSGCRRCGHPRRLNHMPFCTQMLHRAGGGPAGLWAAQGPRLRQGTVRGLPHQGPRVEARGFQPPPVHVLPEVVGAGGRAAAGGGSRRRRCAPGVSILDAFHFD
eukprot:COSAG01_NODE_2252_length_8074_cov_37.778809_9_plen_310_part_00